MLLYFSLFFNFESANKMLYFINKANHSFFPLFSPSCLKNVAWGNERNFPLLRG